ncbi:StfH/YfcO family fimbrial adhesin, partial [Escherichia sp. TWPC-MK]
SELTFVGPIKIPAPYDVSWNENYVVHNKVVRLQSTGGVIEQTLPTFLMENGKLAAAVELDSYVPYSTD